jgi:hypothetical protein
MPHDSTPHDRAPDADPTASLTDDDLVKQVRSATELLEAVASDPSVLEALSEAERIRLRAAAGNVFAPDVAARRELVRARQRRERAEKIRRDEAARDQTGIRTLRAKPVFTTPNVFPPEDFDAEAAEAGSDELDRDLLDPQHCYVCKEHFTEVHHFYDQL